MPTAPPDRVLPNPLRRIAACARVVNRPPILIAETVMPSHLPADQQQPAQPPELGVLDALITQAHRLRGGIDAVRRGAGGEFDVGADDARTRWQRALCDLAVHHLDDLGDQLGQLREGAPSEPPAPAEPAAGEEAAAYGTSAAPVGPGSLVARVGSAEWNLLTDEVSWSE